MNLIEWRVTRINNTFTGWYKGVQFFVLAPSTYMKGSDQPDFTLYVLFPGFKKQFKLNTVERGQVKAERVIQKFKEKFKTMAWVEWEHDGMYGVHSRGKVRGVHIFTIIFNASGCPELRCTLPGISKRFGGTKESTTGNLEKLAEKVWVFFRNKMFKL